MKINRNLRMALATAFGGIACLCASGAFVSNARASETEKTAAAPSVQLGPVAIPVIVDGQIANYLYLSVKVNLNSPLDESALREKEPYFRDALIRASYKTSFAIPGHIDQLDEPRFKAAMMPLFTQIGGPNSIKSIEIAPRGTRKHAR